MQHALGGVVVRRDGVDGGFAQIERDLRQLRTEIALYQGRVQLMLGHRRIGLCLVRARGEQTFGRVDFASGEYRPEQQGVFAGGLAFGFERQFVWNQMGQHRA